MSRTYYPSDEYDSFDLEQERAKRRRRWFKTLRRDDDDDDPPTAPVAGGFPKSPPLGAAQAA
jgi:hypothetical protein